MSAQFTKKFVRLRQVLTIRVLPFVQVWDGIEANAIHAHGQPEIADLLHRIVHGRVIKVQVRLMRIKAMPIVCFGDRVPRPVRRLEVFENDSCITVFFRRVAPNIKILVDQVVG